MSLVRRILALGLSVTLLAGIGMLAEQWQTERMYRQIRPSVQVQTPSLVQQEDQTQSEPEEEALARSEAESAPEPAPEQESPSAPESQPEPAPEPLPEVVEQLMQVDLEQLRQTNPEVVGWICVPDTQLDYPVLQGEDNQFYLNHTWQGKRSAAGSVFLESELEWDPEGFHTLVYGHNMKNGSMFGSLRQYRTQSHYQANPVIYFADADGVRRYEIFAALEAKVVSWIYRLDLDQTEKQQAFLDYSMEHNVLDTDLVPTPADRIITLSTCTGDGYEERWVVQGMLTGYYPRQTADPEGEAAPAAERCTESGPVSEGTAG